jgi:hypothetical protein
MSTIIAFKVSRFLSAELKLRLGERVGADKVSVVANATAHLGTNSFIYGLPYAVHEVGTDEVFYTQDRTEEGEDAILQYRIQLSQPMCAKLIKGLEIHQDLLDEDTLPQSVIGVSLMRDLQLHIVVGDTIGSEFGDFVLDSTHVEDAFFARRGTEEFFDPSTEMDFKSVNSCLFTASPRVVKPIEGADDTAAFLKANLQRKKTRGKRRADYKAQDAKPRFNLEKEDSLEQLVEIPEASVDTEVNDPLNNL